MDDKEDALLGGRDEMHYQLLHQQYIQQKKEKYDALCKNMFSTKSKKR